MSDELPRDQQVIFLPMRQDLPPLLRITEEAFWKGWHEAQPHQRDAILAKLTAEAEQVERVGLTPPQAGRLLEGLRFLMTDNAFDTMIAPFIAQEREEHCQAMQRGDHRHARWIIVRMHLLISYNATSGIASSIVRLIIKIRNTMGA
jgi:hypothetical protein